MTSGGVMPMRPAIGAVIRNTAREPVRPVDGWVKSARLWRDEPEADRDQPVKSDQAAWLIRRLCATAIAASTR